jgi:predicted proteasome-type protease
MLTRTSLLSLDSVVRSNVEINILPVRVVFSRADEYYYDQCTMKNVQ